MSATRLSGVIWQTGFLSSIWGRQACYMVPKTGQAGFPGRSVVVVCPMKPVVAMLQDGPCRSSTLGARKARVHAPETQMSLAAVGRP